jgi:hypothetical protein
MNTRTRRRTLYSLATGLAALVTMGIKCDDSMGPNELDRVLTQILADAGGTGSGRVIPLQPPSDFTLDCRIASGALDVGTTCTEDFDDQGAGGSFQLEAIADAGSVFAGWTDCDASPATSASCNCTGTGLCGLSFDANVDPVFDVTARFDLVSSPALCSGPARSTFADAMLADTDWTDQIIFDTSVGQPAAFVSAQDPNEGNPAPARSTDHSYCADGVSTNAGLIVAHWHDDVFDPGNQDAAFLSFAFDMRVFPSQGVSNAQVAFRALIRQGDSFYEGPNMLAHVNDLTWTPYDGSCLVPQDFVRRAGTGPGLPDFSLPMQFGYATANSSPIAACPIMTTNYVDNWSVEVR